MVWCPSGVAPPGPNPTRKTQAKYTGLLEGTQKLESSLHHHLIEHLNAEIVLNTITDVSIALEWLKSTFLYIRILKNPTHYGIPEGLEKKSLEQKLQDICLKSLNTLEKAGLIKMDDGFDLKPTGTTACSFTLGLTLRERFTSSGLTELQMLKNDFTSLQNSVTLAKCMKARLWENSKFVSKQLEKVGPSLSTMMVNAGLITFKKIEETNPREIEMIVNRHPPFGSQIRESASSLPKYELSVQQTGRHQPNRAEIVINLTMTNYIKRRDVIGSGRNNHFCLVLISDADNKVVFKQRLSDAVFMKEGCWSKRVDVQRAAVKSSALNIHLISQEHVGLDVSKIFSPHYTGVGPYIVVSRITINLYIRDNITSLLTTVFGCIFVVFVVVVVVIAVFVVTNFNFCFTTVRLSFSGCGFLFV
ncbi:probable ATP-dependent DNA helicase HFM1 [Orbicella faveolata]|uniref:probable ATP-dependent DNA helicase HFM1 n=1 Tax=Orbicella faveolata TaxID=48498 RepID=UPI0009E2A967|nr:probable ATP-dependent DNA helicase HFM1 [Orbicella faveolata]